jgi:hypothetical protein
LGKNKSLIAPLEKNNYRNDLGFQA